MLTASHQAPTSEATGIPEKKRSAKHSLRQDIVAHWTYQSSAKGGVRNSHNLLRDILG
jgi:hypothetical protein